MTNMYNINNINEYQLKKQEKTLISLYLSAFRLEIKDSLIETTGATRECGGSLFVSLVSLASE